ncbi:MAG TPA: hypothetical protein VK404_09635 [Spirosoma sp.]|nr:hypothetical protein [Spirosoma sp.]
MKKSLGGLGQYPGSHFSLTRQTPYHLWLMSTDNRLFTFPQEGSQRGKNTTSSSSFCPLIHLISARLKPCGERSNYEGLIPINSSSFAQLKQVLTTIFEQFDKKYTIGFS